MCSVRGADSRPAEGVADGSAEECADEPWQQGAAGTDIWHLLRWNPFQQKLCGRQAMGFLGGSVGCEMHPEVVDDGWEQVRSRLDSAVRSLPWESFVLVRHGAADEAPYAQAAPGPAGWYVEVVSAAYLPATDWPLDEEWLRTTGWQDPDGDTLNWWRTRTPVDEVAGLLLDGLRCGRGCSDPGALVVTVGRFPDGPDGGEPLPVLDADEALAA